MHTLNHVPVKKLFVFSIVSGERSLTLTCMYMVYHPQTRTPSETERSYSVHAQNYGITGPIKQIMGVRLETGTL